MIISTQTLTIADLLKGDIKLASPPIVYLALQKVIENPTKTAKDAALVIESDAALALRLLKIVNSAFYGFPAQISAISTAITLIGVRELQSLVLATVVIERFSDLPGQLFSVHDFWAKNLRCALIARELDLQMGKNFSDTAFLCGLVHDIGQLVLYRRIPILAREVDLLVQSQSAGEVDQAGIEQQVIGFDHYALGAELCRLWKLPPVVVESIRLHRYPDHVGSHAQIATLIRLADHFSRVDNHYDAFEGNGFELSPEQISLVMDKTHDEFEDIFKLFFPSL
ncbi:MAG: HDOD domain-containing protein [Methylomonas sp.]|jgi:HD-like signal output (HDOD) protein|uniref:HDOD domain-containing protein n=1 Tax=Methylomonas sp. TaxID=418 RepID=UPI0025EE6465|nr:HDOD domain-containing protein [Methylomonas sp.]MCK9607270.1 HDOD domain-containing protein [Methylomonas sp.]